MGVLADLSSIVQRFEKLPLIAVVVFAFVLVMGLLLLLLAVQVAAVI